MRTYRIIEDLGNRGSYRHGDVVAKNKKEAIQKFSKEIYAPHQMQMPSEKEKRNWYKNSFEVDMIKVVKKELGLKDKEIAEFFGYNNKASYANSSGKVKIENGIVAIVEHMKSQGWSKPESS